MATPVASAPIATGANRSHGEKCRVGAPGPKVDDCVATLANVTAPTIPAAKPPATRATITVSQTGLPPPLLDAMLENIPTGIGENRWVLYASIGVEAPRTSSVVMVTPINQPPAAISGVVPPRRWLESNVSTTGMAPPSVVAVIAGA